MAKYIICHKRIVFYYTPLYRNIYLGQMLCRKEMNLALYSVLGIAGEMKKRVKG